MWPRIALNSVIRHQLSMRMKKMIIKKRYAGYVISIEFIKTVKYYFQACHKTKTAIFTSNPGASLTFFMFINLFIKLVLIILF